MGKITIPEDQPASELETQWMDELKQIYGEERLAANSVSDLDLLRFCRAYVNEENPKQKTFDTVKEFLEWRESEKIDELASQDYERFNEFVQAWPCGFHGIADKDGSVHPIYIDRMGAMSPSSFGEKFSNDEYIKFHIQIMENLQDIKNELSSRLGRPVYKHVVIVDLDGFGMKHLWDREAINNLVKLDSTKYPETLHKMLVINPPFMFKMAYAMFSGLMDDTTKSRIHILKKPTDLLDHVQASQLPKEYGGLIEYTKEEPIFTRPFSTAEGHPTEYDDVFSNLLEKRRARLAQKQALIAASAANVEEANKPVEDATATTTTTATTEPTTTSPTKSTTSAPAPAEEEKKPQADEQKPEPFPAAAVAEEEKKAE